MEQLLPVQKENTWRIQLTSEFSDEKFKNYFRMTRNDFKEVHVMIATDLEDQGYGGHEQISTEEKLAVFLR